MNFAPGTLRQKLNAARQGQKLMVNPVGELGAALREVHWPEPDPNIQRGGGTVVIPGGRRPRRRASRGPIGDTKNDLRG